MGLREQKEKSARRRSRTCPAESPPAKRTETFSFAFRVLKWGKGYLQPETGLDEGSKLMYVPDHT